MEDNESMDMQEALVKHVCYLMETMDDLDPVSEEYRVIKSAIMDLANIAIRIDEIQMKYENEEDQRAHEEKIKILEIEAAERAREAERRLKEIEQEENRRWHTIDMILRIGTITISALTTLGFLGTAWVQTRANYVDNIYDSSPSARMILTAIGKLVKPVN